MISQAVEYSIRAMAILARHGNASVTIQALADEGQIPAPYLAKLLQSLSKAQLVKARRGLNGGYQLAKPAGQISLADVINVIEPLQRIARCPLGIPGHESLCPLHQKLDDAMAHVEKVFQETTLESLVRSTQTNSPLCRMNQQVYGLS